MRKIFSAALALVCVWFATPSWAACNLFDPSLLFRGYWMNNPDVLTQENHYRVVSLNLNPGTYTFSTDVPDTRLLRVYVNGAYQEFQNPIANNKYTFTVTQSGLFSIVFRGLDSGTTIPYETQVQIEKGTTATAYTPYNPLCATCDGTVVNYTSATGTVSQAGTPTPTNPIEPTFYKQGNMILRKVGDYADSYDATTGKITRNVGVLTLRKNLSWYTNGRTGYFYLDMPTAPYQDSLRTYNTHFPVTLVNSTAATGNVKMAMFTSGNGTELILIHWDEKTTLAAWQNWLEDQYAAGTPVIIYYPLATPVVEDWTETSYCETPIKIATTKYNESAFGPLNAALANAISVVDTVVSNTITQAASIATLQAQKQTRPANDTCPAYKQCLLVEDENGTPHWYEITDPFRDFVAPIIANNVKAASSTYSGTTWSASWIADVSKGVDAITIYGETLCNGVVAEEYTIATNEQFNSENWNVDGVNCWCRMTGIDANNEFISSTSFALWVAQKPFNSFANCQDSCSDRCVTNVKYQNATRKMLFGFD